VELNQAYASAGLDCGDGLLPPIDESAIEALAQELSMPLPAELREVYRTYGGQETIDPGTTGLFGEHRLLTPDEVVEHYQMFCENCLLDPLPAFPPAPDDWGYWVPQLIPFASWDAYDLCIDSETGEVWEFIPNTGLIRHRPSIAAVLSEVLDAVRSGREPQLLAMRGPA
jgi:cell wall assembly regulator SMI1